MAGQIKVYVPVTVDFRADEYICSVCGRSYPKPYDFCPGCGARPGKVKYDPHWVAEMEMMDILFDDDEDF